MKIMTAGFWLDSRDCMAKGHNAIPPKCNRPNHSGYQIPPAVANLNSTSEG